MIIKEADSRDADVLELQQLLACQISAKQRFLIERELKCIGSGLRGEETSAYYMDFRYQDSRNWAVIHDLRLELNGFTAQIDHLLINRFLEIYVLESKNYYYGIKIGPEGDFMAWNGRAFVGIESPIEQNRRHVTLLEKVIARAGILPTRLGIAISPTYHNYVLVAPTSRIDRPVTSQFVTSMVVKADALVETISKRIDAMGVVETFASAAKMVSSETLETFGRSLVSLHKPARFNYANKFGVVLAMAPPQAAESVEQAARQAGGKNVCEGGGVEVESKVVNFCRFNKAKFGGKTLCQTCQKADRSPQTTSTEAKVVEPEPIGNYAEEKAGVCEGCGSAVDKKVVFFCRMNKKKFDGKVLCRYCQLP